MRVRRRRTDYILTLRDTQPPRRRTEVTCCFYAVQGRTGCCVHFLREHLRLPWELWREKVRRIRDYMLFTMHARVAHAGPTAAGLAMARYQVMHSWEAL